MAILSQIDETISLENLLKTMWFLRRSISAYPLGSSLESLGIMAKKTAARIPTLDLHGRTTAEVFDLLDDFLRRESNRGTARVRIMPGKGTGKVKDVTLDYLKKAHYPWQFEKLDNGAKNEGVLIVFLE